MVPGHGFGSQAHDARKRHVRSLCVRRIEGLFLSRENGVMVWLRAAFFALLGPGTALGWGPVAILSSTQARFSLGPARWLGLLLLVPAVSALLSCIWEFANSGRGTLAPIDEPRFVVRGGLYRWVRNPMYVSVIIAFAGEIILFQSPWLILWAAGFGTAFSVFVVVYEEPHLASRFGESYEEYRRSVPRWFPRRPRTTRAAS
jgi:protein-S-isoprenylcysteine O-methyltransferase Ste14